MASRLLSTRCFLQRISRQSALETRRPGEEHTSVLRHLGPSFPLRTRQWMSTKNDDVPNEERKPDEATEPKKKKKAESFQETIHRLRGDEKAEGSAGDAESSDLGRRMAAMWSAVSNEVNLAWNDLVQSGNRQSINKKIHPVATQEGDAPYTGPVDILVIDPSENLTAWERMQKRLTEAPIIQDMLSRTEEFYEQSGANKAKARLDEIKEDAQEAWETSQNPWIYRASSVYDTLTAESAETLAVKELRILDPTFTLDDWRRDVVEHTLPQLMEWFLQGKTNQLKGWFGDAVFQRVAAEISARKKEGVEIDTHVLGIMNSEILSVEPDVVEKGSPIILLHFMVQQINCVRKKEDGSIVEGSEDDIRANSYVAAFQREYREEEGDLIWKIVDFRFNGAIAYL